MERNKFLLNCPVEDNSYSLSLSAQSKITHPKVHNRRVQFCPHISKVILFPLSNETSSSVVLSVSDGSHTKLLPDRNQNNYETRKSK